MCPSLRKCQPLRGELESQEAGRSLSKGQDDSCLLRSSVRGASDAASTSSLELSGTLSATVINSTHPFSPLSCKSNEGMEVIYIIELYLVAQLQSHTTKFLVVCWKYLPGGSD